jgi:hypothetical protein
MKNNSMRPRALKIYQQKRFYKEPAKSDILIFVIVRNETFLIVIVPFEEVYSTL